MKKEKHLPGLLEREKIIGDAVKSVAAELRLVDLDIMARFIYLEQHANIADLVASSCELFFKENTLIYGARADIELKWGEIPDVVLDLEFHHQGVQVFFALSLRPLVAAVDVHAITFDGEGRSPEDNTARLMAALEDARIGSPNTLAAAGIAAGFNDDDSRAG
ncbi:MAG: hypothetical protein JJU21_09825 [Salinarimonas sp.]|nr:hypothetical protein [Salinarimonas sp.]